MSKENNISPGFKSSPIGPIPSDWGVKRLGTLVEIVSGVSPSLFNLNIVGKYPYLKVEDLNNCDKYQLESREYSNDEKSLVPINSIIFPKRGAAILNNKVRINSVVVQMDSNLMAIYPKSEDLGYEYLYYQIIFRQLYKIADTSTIPQINNKHIIPYSFPLPPLPEQTAIAACLSAWDEAINNCQLIIDNCQLRKKWLMQQLLTGKKRLPGFCEEWKEFHLGEMFKERNETRFVDLPLLSVGANGIYPQSDSIKRDISNDDKSKYKRIVPGDIGYNTMRMWQGRNALSYLEGIVSPAYTIVTPNSNADSRFFSYLFKTPKVMNLFWRNSQGLVDDTLNCKFKDFEIVRIKLPNKEEQVAIAHVLQIADKEINLLKTKLDKLKEQKRGLMQVLLTGRKRLNTKILKQTSLDNNLSSS